MLTDNIFKEIKFGNKKCDSFLDVASYDQIKGKLDCLQFLSTPKAFDCMMLTEQDFYQSKKEETFEKISTMTPLNNLELNKKDKKAIGSKLHASSRNKNKIDSSTFMKFRDEKSLKGFFAESVKNFDNANRNKLKDKTKAKTSLDILEFFKFSSENGVSLHNMQKNIQTLKEVTGKKIKKETSKRTEDHEEKIFRHDGNPNKIIEQNSRNFLLKRNANEIDLDSKVISNRYRSSSSDNRISTSFFTTSPIMVTLKRKNTIISKIQKIRSKSNLTVFPIEKLMKKNENTRNFNEIITNIQTNEKNLLTDTNIEDFCTFSMGRQNLRQKDFENFLKLKKLENESQKVIVPNYDLIYDKKSKNLEPFINTKLQKNIKNSSKLNVNTKFQKKSESSLKSVKDLFEKNPKQVDKNEISRMIDYCYKSTKSNTNLLSENFKDHSNNKLVEGVLTKLKGECNTPADEYIKNLTLQNYKQKTSIMYVSSSRGINKKKFI